VESVVAVEGVIRPRPVDAINADMRTGTIEVLIGSRHTLSCFGINRQ
jgi:aspartyl-tRNA synthetase